MYERWQNLSLKFDQTRATLGSIMFEEEYFLHRWNICESIRTNCSQSTISTKLYPTTLAISFNSFHYEPGRFVWDVSAAQILFPVYFYPLGICGSFSLSATNGKMSAGTKFHEFLVHLIPRDLFIFLELKSALKERRFRVFGMPDKLSRRKSHR